jgi:hypothetical protein
LIFADLASFYFFGLTQKSNKKSQGLQQFPKKNHYAGKKTNSALPVVLLQLVPSIGPFVLRVACLHTAFSLLLATHDFFLYGNSCEAGREYMHLQKLSR